VKESLQFRVFEATHPLAVHKRCLFISGQKKT